MRVAWAPGCVEPLELLEGRFVFADGAGVHIWPAGGALLEYLRGVGTNSDAASASEATAREGAGSEASWRGKRVLELGCGCGFVSAALARWGCEVLATDVHDKALELASANAELCAREGAGFRVRRLDFSDPAACARLREDLGPFACVVACDCVLATPPSGPMWRSGAASAAAVAAPPEALLDATRVLVPAGAEVVLAVVDRGGDVQATARALLDRRHWLQLVSLPVALPATEGGTAVTVFHFRWKGVRGAGGEAAAALWEQT